MRISSLRAAWVAVVLALVVTGCDDDGVIMVPDAGPAMDAGMADAGPPMYSCDDTERNGNETGVDCGGDECEPCPPGDPCMQPSDCASSVCDRGRCLMGTCSDGVRNGEETGADCGGDCGLCPGGEPCTSNDECISNRCRAGECTMSSCEDGTQNNDETDIDCGGPTCPACIGGLTCVENTDCVSLICSMGACTDAACNDSVQNQDETSVDCGGSICPPCRDGLGCVIDADCEGMRCFMGGCVSCMDRIVNAEETDVDCGGPLCAACADGDMCLVDSDCSGGTCEAGLCVSCMDGVQNQDETDVDCGGALCGGCADGLTCTGDGDCGNPGATCEGGTCQSCSDGVVNRTETDVDCGGGVCPACGPGLICTVNADCASNICDGPTGRCNAAGCGDGVINGAETDLDCGGGSCLGCNVGQSCVLGRDCLTGVCTGGVCQAPTCTDGVSNGGETGVDCGGATTCPRCPDFSPCTAPTDCMTGACTMGICGSTGCIPFPGGATDTFGYFGCTIPLTPATLPCPDISSTGTLGPASDDSEVTVPIGFDFDYYGTVRSSITIGSNGNAAFDSTFLDYFNACGLPAFSPYEQLNPFWDDLNPSSGGTVRYQTVGTAPNRQFVVRWNVQHYSSSPNMIDVTMVLNETTNDIEFCYDDTTFGDTNDHGASATIGITSAASHLEFSCDTPSLTDGLYMLFNHP